MSNWEGTLININKYDFSDKKLIETKHKFEIDVLDNVGNKSTLSATFYKKS